MGQALYRKYRSKKLAEIVGQEHITRVLGRALKEGHISHAYLFTGPRGLGKTSIARILAHEVNGLPYQDDAPHLDIIEIDAASNRRIDEIRDLRERVHIAPTSATYKVYIIDEAHMLTREAFNALLKTLEEPPAHVIFILATTEAQKLPETIVSRTQRFNFRPVETEKIVSHLRDIAAAEHIKIDDPALELIARHGEGTFRDSINLLDQVRASGQAVHLNDVRTMLGLAPDELLQDIMAAVEQDNVAAVVTNLQQAQLQGLEAAQLAKQLGQAWRAKLLTGSIDLPKATVLTLLRSLLSVGTSPDPFTALEITLLQATNEMPQPSAAKPASNAAASIPPVRHRPSVAAAATPPAKTKPVTAIQPARLSAEPLGPEVWQQLLQAIKHSHNTLYGIIRMAEPQFSDDSITLSFRFAFHKKRVNEAANRTVITRTLQELTGRAIAITCELSSKQVAPTVSTKTTAQTGTAPLETISNIFGGAELLESEN